MNVFICWSGEASHKLAEGLREWLPRVIQATKPFLSSEDISKGNRWHTELNSQLETTDYGVLCMTPENLLAPWILFEAGALSKNTASGRVSALLLSVKQSDLSPPLGQFQHTEPNFEDMHKLVRSVNVAMKPEVRLADANLEASFRAHWPFFEDVITSARDVLRQAKKEAPRPRPTGEMFEEIIGMLRDIQRARLVEIPTIGPPASWLYTSPTVTIDSPANSLAATPGAKASFTADLTTGPASTLGFGTVAAAQLRAVS